MRLEHAVQEACHSSRNETKRLLKKGEVQVNGQIVRDGAYNVDGAIDTVTVKGNAIPLFCHHYYMLNKPAGVVTAKTDAKDKTVFDLLPNTPNLSSVGRLDKDTTGLILASDNGILCYHLTQKIGQVEKVYDVIVNGKLTARDVHNFESGIVFDDGVMCQPARLEIIHTTPTESRARVTLKEGKRHQVKKMFLCCGVKVTQLKRIQIGSLSLDDTLKQGEWRELTTEEIAKLMQQTRRKQA